MPNRSKTSTSWSAKQTSQVTPPKTLQDTKEFWRQSDCLRPCDSLLLRTAIIYWLSCSMDSHLARAYRTSNVIVMAHMQAVCVLIPPLLLHCRNLARALSIMPLGSLNPIPKISATKQTPTPGKEKKKKKNWLGICKTEGSFTGKVNVAGTHCWLPGCRTKQYFFIVTSATAAASTVCLYKLVGSWPKYTFISSTILPTPLMVQNCFPPKRVPFLQRHTTMTTTVRKV